METMIILIVAVAALCCMGTNLVMVCLLLYRKGERTMQEPEKTREELERERKELEAQRKELEGIQNMMAYTGFKWRENKE